MQIAVTRKVIPHMQCVGCARFLLSRSHNLVVWLLLALHPRKSWSSGGKCSFTS